MKKKIIVIGSGIGGLGAAVRLLAQGHEVEIFEALDKPGGSADSFELDGFNFAGQPATIAAPFMVDDLWSLAGKQREDDLEFASCDPFYRIFDAQGEHFDYSDDEMSVLNELQRRNPADKRGYLNFMHSSKALFKEGFVEQADKPFLSRWNMGKTAADLIRHQSHKSVYRYVSQFFEDEFLRQAFSFHPLLLGGNPLNTPSIYALIPALEREWGVRYVVGGMGALVQAFAKLIDELGGKLQLGTEVEEILVDEHERRVRGIRLTDGSSHYANEVVSNAEVAFTYRNLIAAKHRKKYSNQKLERMRYSMSLFISFFGTKKQYRDKLKPQNIIFGRRYRELLDAIFKRQQLPEDHSLYLGVPTMVDPSLAPAGCDAFCVIAPVPNQDSGIDWTTQAEPYHNAIKQFLEENYLPALQENLVVEKHLDPRHFQDTLHYFKGAAFSFAPTLKQTGYFRPHNRSEEFSNLYFVGAGTHPGAGLPGVLSSAKIAGDLIGRA